MRHAALADLAHLTKLEAETFTYDLITTRQFRYQLTKANVLFEVIIDSQNRLMGYGLVFFKKGCTTGNLYGIAVHPSAHGKGYGRKILASLEKGSLKKGMTRLSARTKVSNIPMQKLFESQGWRRGKVLKAYYSDGEDGYFYERILQK